MSKLAHSLNSRRVHSLFSSQIRATVFISRAIRQAILFNFNVMESQAATTTSDLTLGSLEYLENALIAFLNFNDDNVHGGIALCQRYIKKFQKSQADKAQFFVLECEFRCKPGRSVIFIDQFKLTLLLQPQMTRMAMRLLITRLAPGHHNLQRHHLHSSTR